MSLFLIGSALAALLLGGDPTPGIAPHAGARARAAGPARPAAARPERGTPARRAAAEAARAAQPLR